MSRNIGTLSVQTNDTNGTQDFDIMSFCAPSNDDFQFGYMVVDGFPLFPISIIGKEIESVNKERAQMAYDSFTESKGKYNAVPFPEGFEDQLTDFDMSLLDEGRIASSLFSFFGKAHIVVQSTFHNKGHFRFNIWDKELGEQVYNKTMKDRNQGKNFDEFMAQYKTKLL